MYTASADIHISTSDLLFKAENFKYNDREKSYRFAKEALILAEETANKEHLIHSLTLIAYSQHHRALHEEFFSTIERVFSLADESGDDKAKAYACYLCACCYRNLGDYSNSAEHFLESLNLSESVKDIETTIRTLNGLGHLYNILGDHYKALESLKKGLSLMMKFDNPQLKANLLGNQADVFINLKRHDEAKENLQIVATIYHQLNDLSGLGVTRLRLGKLHYAMDETDECIAVLSELYENAVTSDFKIGITVVGGDFGKILIELGRYEEAIPYIDSALRVSTEINYHNNEYELYYLKYKIAVWQKDYKIALDYYERYHKLKEKTFTHEAELKLKNAESLTEIQLVKKESELNRLKHVELKKAYEEIEIKNKEITDSIRYARRIQSAILPDHQTISEAFPDHFIIFQPRNIVSGDFYYYQCALNSDRSKKLFAVADCTGHGVPGSLMSMIGSTLLNQVVISNGFTDPAEILENLDKDLCRALKVHKGESRDGMDIVIAVYDTITKELKFASAMRPVYIYCSEDKLFSEVAGTKRSIGGANSHSVSYQTNSVQLKSNDRIYLFSDGYADQFGGVKGKKLLAKNFKSILQSTTDLKISEQGNKMLEFFNTWKGDHEQVDDVTLVGIQVK